MKICIDIQSAVTQTAGVGRYTSQLVRHLDSLPDTDLTLFYFDFRGNGTPPPVSRTAVKRNGWMPGSAAQYMWKKLHWPPFDFFTGKFDLYHFPNFIIPPLGSGKAVVTIHDMSFERYPLFAEEKNLAFLRTELQRTVTRADAIITDSRFSAREISDLTGTTASKIFTVYPGISRDFKRPPDAETEQTLAGLGITRPYILTVGTIEPRKNIPFLVDMFEKMTSFDGQLVIAGRPGWKCEPVFGKIAASPRGAAVKTLTRVADSDLPALYSGASLFVIASFYEGFGFPPLEAMACGTPVLSSKGGSLEEVLGDAAVIMDNFDAETWAGRAMKIVSDADEQKRLAEKGVHRASTFRWTDTAAGTLDVYRNALK